MNPTFAQHGIYVDLAQANVFDINLRWMTVVVVYLFRVALRPIRDKIKNECSPGTIIISVGVRS